MNRHEYSYGQNFQLVVVSRDWRLFNVRRVYIERVNTSNRESCSGSLLSVVDYSFVLD